MAGTFVDVDERALEKDALPCDRKALRLGGEKTLEHGINLATDHAFVRSRKPCITKKCRTAWEDLLIGGLLQLQS